MHDKMNVASSNLKTGFVLRQCMVQLPAVISSIVSLDGRLMIDCQPAR